MKNLATKTFLVLLGLSSLALIGTIVYGVYFINNKSIETARTVSLVEEGGKNSILVQSINSANNNSDNELAQLEELALSQEKLVSFIETLEGLAESMNIDIKIVSVNIEAGKGVDNPDKIHFNIETNGSWSTSMQFLKAIEHLPFRTMISNTTLATKNSSPIPVVESDRETVVVGKSWKLTTDLAVYSFN